jgi:hypothetical protein
MDEPKIELAFTREELGLLWDALSHKERYHLEFAEKLQADDNKFKQRAVDVNTRALARVKALCDYLEEAMDLLQSQSLTDGHPKDVS